jgi:hypothetical protein
MSMRKVRSFSKLLLISAALLLDVSGAEAAGTASDAQELMRQVLAGHIKTQSPALYAQRDDRAGRPATDARDFAARVLLGGGTARIQATGPKPQSKSIVAPGRLPARERSLATDDAQALARQVVLGQRNLSSSDSRRSSARNSFRLTERTR